MHQIDNLFEQQEMRRWLLHASSDDHAAKMAVPQSRLESS